MPNMHVKPNSCIDPSTTKSVFKGFPHRTHTVCLEKHIKGETQYLVDMFVENGHKRTFLANLIKEKQWQSQLDQLKENPVGT